MGSAQRASVPRAVGRAHSPPLHIYAIERAQTRAPPRAASLQIGAQKSGASGDVQRPGAPVSVLIELSGSAVPALCALTLARSGYARPAR